MISKSGTTTEPAIAFRIFRKLFEEKYGKEEAQSEFMQQQIKQRGALKTVATKKALKLLLFQMMSAAVIQF